MKQYLLANISICPPSSQLDVMAKISIETERHWLSSSRMCWAFKPFFWDDQITCQVDVLYVYFCFVKNHRETHLMAFAVANQFLHKVRH